MVSSLFLAYVPLAYVGAVLGWTVHRLLWRRSDAALCDVIPANLFHEAFRRIVVVFSDPGSTGIYSCQSMKTPRFQLHILLYWQHCSWSFVVPCYSQVGTALDIMHWILWKNKWFWKNFLIYFVLYSFNLYSLHTVILVSSGSSLELLT